MIRWPLAFMAIVLLGLLFLAILAPFALLAASGRAFLTGANSLGRALLLIIRTMERPAAWYRAQQVVRQASTAEELEDLLGDVPTKTYGWIWRVKARYQRWRSLLSSRPSLVLFLSTVVLVSTISLSIVALGTIVGWLLEVL